ncbi:MULTISPECIES: GTP-binding protein [Prochlorococcus]|uniref:Small GTP-binding protein domain n=1 Tax=Prochlorococcus marinus str. MIT 9116 TaxID=167544 RepID=A0A0A1ZT34_PROMR|nr:GTP-binding protein [Prochlorococcus marinus]KGF91185.1 Small GTP-binding protein domain [Prochlorococcus marinus str. MIT 9107]KGF92545.1 Small GTP-binding protein domain [Prochlorococcus marinus str. MIT 9116]KGF93787.1 Small GTP-binding protein domain [Prochlorococcus marinus str. MIT 9123]
MKELKINKNYLLLKNWWERIDLTNYEKSFFNSEIISFNQQLFRLKEKKIRIGVYGKSGVGKSSVLNTLFKKHIFKTDIINGSTKKIQAEEWALKNQTLKSIELLDSPGFDFCNIKFPDKIHSHINHSDLILFIVAGDINRNEVSEISSFIKNGKKIIIVLNKIDLFKKNELKEITENIKFKLPKDLNIPIIINHENNLNDYLTKIINQYGEILLTLNSLQLADKLFIQLKKQRLKRRQKLAQSTIGKFSTIKASAVALNPFILFDITGSFALDTALISELSKIYGLNLKGESTRKIFKNISINNLFLGVTQIGINTSFNLIRKLILLTAPFTNGLSLLPYGPIAIIQAAIAVHSTKILGKLAAKEIFIRSKVSYIEPFTMIKNITFQEPEIFNHINFYLSNRNLNNNFMSFLP